MAGDSQFPGIYVAEEPAQRPAIMLRDMTIAAFVGAFPVGPIGQPIAVMDWPALQAQFVGTAAPSNASLAARAFFDNGGSSAVILRVDETASGDREAPYAEGLQALERVDFALLCIPAPDDFDLSSDIHARATQLCEHSLAFYIADPPKSWLSASDPHAAVRDGVVRLLAPSASVALYWPWIVVPVTPGGGGATRQIGPCGAVAGVFVRTDATRGVWKAPAGPKATISGVTGLTHDVGASMRGDLTRQAVNVLISRTSGTVIWGGRTLADEDGQGSEWRYVSVRRLALLIERSIVRGLDWVSFEPNGEALWASVRLVIASALDDLFALGAFEGQTAQDAWFVRCDQSTMTQDDFDSGRLGIVIGFAPIRPAEFVIIRIGLWTSDHVDAG